VDVLYIVGAARNMSALQRFLVVDNLLKISLHNR